MSAAGLLRCCDASGCRAAGSAALLEALVAARRTQPAAATIRPVGCLRLCSAGPLLAWDGPAGPRLYGGLTPDQAADLIAETAAATAAVAAEPTAAPALAVAEPDPLATYRLDPAHPFFSLQQPVVLEDCGQVDPESIEQAIAQGTYAQWRRALLELSPEAVREEVRRSGLRGRGGAGYPTGLKWDTVALQPPGPRHVVCNADEGDPGAFMDRCVLEGDPHRLIEGMAIAAHAVGAEQGWIYVRAEYPLAIARLRRAVQQAEAHGLLGAALFGTDRRLRIRVRVGAGAYVCGEETALLASIEGRRGTPRPRPPFPAQRGLGGSPTLINNVETLAAIPAILRQGGDWYAAMGTAGSRGTKVFSLSGAVRHTGVVEVPMGISLRTIVETMGGGAPEGSAIKAVQTGGPSGGCIPAERLDTPVDYEALRELGSIMGSGGMVVVDDAMAMPALARHFLRFSVQESCGKCLPCRAGTVQLEQLLQRFVEQRAVAEDLERLEQLCRMVAATSLCGLGQAAPQPVLSTLRHFLPEYLAACRSAAYGSAACGPDACSPATSAAAEETEP